MLYPDIPVWWVTLPVALAGWLVTSVVYRLFFHPLAGIPGPRLAALSYLYRTYFNASGSFYAQIEKLHHEYGKGRVGGVVLLIFMG